MDARGVCHGFLIKSRLEFQTLRHGQGSPLTVEEWAATDRPGDLVHEWLPRPENPFHGRLHRDGDRFRFWANDAGWYTIDARSPAIGVPPGSPGLRRELRMLGIPAALCMREAGDLSIHAAAVDVAGRALLLAGPAHHGKTTLAAGFARRGYRLLSEDTTRCHAARPAVAYPGPAILRLRADVAARLHVPDAAAAALEPPTDRQHLLLDRAARGDGAALPLAAIILLKIGTDLRLRTVSAEQVVRDLWALTFQLPTDEFRAFCFDRLGQLATSTTVLELERPLELGNLDRVVDVLAAAAG